jgi:hypothetical protein
MANVGSGAVRDRLVAAQWMVALRDGGLALYEWVGDLSCKGIGRQGQALGEWGAVQQQAGQPASIAPAHAVGMAPEGQGQGGSKTQLLWQARPGGSLPLRLCFLGAPGESARPYSMWPAVLAVGGGSWVVEVSPCNGRLSWRRLGPVDVCLGVCLALPPTTAGEMI